MAKDEAKGKNLLTTLTEGRLGVPALNERGTESRDPGESSRAVTERGGKSPEEVLGDNAGRKAPVARGDQDEPRETEAAEKKPAIKKYRVRTDDGSGEVVVEALTIAEIAERGLMERIVTSANQLPSLTKKHQDLLERVADKETAVPEKKEQKQEVNPVEFWKQVATAYQPRVEELIKFNVEHGWLEPDLPEAYPQGIKTLFTRIFYQQDVIDDLRVNLQAAIDWINAEVGMRTITKSKQLIEDAVEAVAKKGDGAKGDPMFKDLRDPEIKAEFLEWMRTTVDPKMSSVNPTMVEQLWFGFNAREFLDFTREAAAKPPVTPKRRAANDGSPARIGATEDAQEKSMLERMTDMRLGADA